MKLPTFKFDKRMRDGKPGLSKPDRHEWVAMKALALCCAVLLTLPAATHRLSDFGGKPASGFDNTAAIRAACAKLGSGDTLTLGPGTWEVHSISLPENLRVFEISNRQNITVDGQDALVLLRGTFRANTFYFTHCQGVTLRQISVDVEALPFTQGRVVAVGTRSLTVRIDDGYTVPNFEWVKALYDYQAETRHAIGNFDAVKAFTDLQLLPDRKVLVSFKEQSNPRKQPILPFSIANATGSLVCLKNRVEYKCYHIDVVHCERILLEKINLYGGGLMGVHAQSSRDLRVVSCLVGRKPGTDRLLSVNYDGMHFLYMKGSISVEGCTFEGTGDDGLNINCGKYLGIARFDAKGNAVTTFQATMGYPGEPPVRGDVLRLLDRHSFAVLGQYTVDAASWDEAAKGFQLSFRERLTGALVSNLFVNTAYFPEKVLISNCTFRANRGRGLFLSVGNLTVEQCRFEYTSYPSLMVFGMTRRQAVSGDHIAIRNNTFKGAAGCAIYFNAKDMYKPEGLLAGAFNDVSITGNVIEEDLDLYPKRFKSVARQYPYWSAGMFLSGIRGLRVEGNTIRGYRHAAYLGFSDEIDLSGNKLSSGSKILVDEVTVSKFRTDSPTEPFYSTEHDRSEYYIQNFL